MIRMLISAFASFRPWNHWRRYGKFSRPARFYSETNCSSMNAAGARPLGYRSRDSVGCNEKRVATSSLVFALLFSSRPTAVHLPSVQLAFIALAARIISIVVLAIKSVKGRWPIAHVFKEMRETVKPSRTNSNTSSSIIVVLRILLVGATCLHCCPAPIDASSRGRSSMFGALLNRQTTARCAMASEQRSLLNDTNFSAKALALPMNFVPTNVASSELDDSQAAELMADIIGFRSAELEGQFNRGRFASSHDVNLLNRFASGQRPQRVMTAAGLAY